MEITYKEAALKYGAVHPVTKHGFINIILSELPHKQADGSYKAIGRAVWGDFGDRPISDSRRYPFYVCTWDSYPWADDNEFPAPDEVPELNAPDDYERI